jgi:hypothetical protein
MNDQEHQKLRYDFNQRCSSKVIEKVIEGRFDAAQIETDQNCEA